jgi:putative transposase
VFGAKRDLDEKMKILSHKIRIYPTAEQEDYFKRACGVKRFAYNWALDQSKKHYEETGESLSGYDLCNKLNSIKKEEFPWMREVTKWAPQKAVIQLGDAFKNFYAKRARFPKFKKRGKCRDSFFISLPKIKDKNIKVPRLGPVKLSQEVRFPGRPLSVVISRTSNFWFASVQVELDDSYIYPHICETQEVCGVDLGVKDLAVLDNGKKFVAPRTYRRSERKLKRLQKRLSRKEKGSKNRAKARSKLALQHYRVACKRKDFTHKITTELVKSYRVIGIEDLSVSGMMKNSRLAKSVQDAGFYEFRRQLDYKSKLSGSEIVVADRFFPSTKMCSSCGVKNKDLSLSDRVWECSCGAIHDCDINAAINLRNLAMGHMDRINACGEGSSGSGLGHSETSL